MGNVGAGDTRLGSRALEVEEVVGTTLGSRTWGSNDAVGTTLGV